MVEVRRKILKENDLRARLLRDRFQNTGTRVISLVSSPGSGKTALLERLLTDLRREHRVAALVGDLATENDAARLARSGAAVKQITTGTVCHLDASMVERAVEGWRLEELDYLFIENVGNLVCPSSFDLGEDLRLVLVSTTEGEDKPLKYPSIFFKSDLLVLNKIDLLPYVPFDINAAADNARKVHPEIEIVKVSCTTGNGLQEWMTWLEQRRTGQKTLLAQTTG
jgi:hydrogenase nickel incorporation protein HypB